MSYPRVRFRYRLTLRETGEVFYAQTRRAVRFARLLWGRNGGRIKVQPCEWEKRYRALFMVWFFGPDTDPLNWKDRGRIVRLHKLWVTSDSLARLFAWKWELDKRNVANFLRGDRYAGPYKRRVPCPHAGRNLPF